MKERRKAIWWFLFSIVLGFNALYGSDWAHWRGPHHNGVSPETGLISNWSIDGENLIWKTHFVGRSTPIVMNGRVYVVGRTGQGITAQRVVACYDAEDGKLLWEDKNNVFKTTVPLTRVGWSSLSGDPETGNIYLFGVDGLFVCYDKDGKVLWQHSTVEEYNRFSGYGGRTATPVIDEDLVIVNFANNSWGNLLIMRHRFFAFDKRTGDVVWISTINSGNKNTNYSVPVVTMINGQRCLVTGAGDGAVYAMKVRTGEQIWKFNLSKGAIQSSVVVANNKVYASHSAENFDNTSFGRVVCIDATGHGDVTATHEVWRADALEAGYTSPLLHDGRLYVVSNKGNLIALDAETGKEHWVFNLGKVGKGSPVWADGKIFATEVNGGFHIIEPGENEAKSLDSEQIAFDDTRMAELFGSPAIAYGRIYFTSEVGLFCLGDKNAAYRVTKPSMLILEEPAVSGASSPARIQIVPAEIWSNVNDKVAFKVRAFDNMGRRAEEAGATFSLDALSGTVSSDGVFTADAKAGNQAGYLVAKLGDLETRARVQVATDLPLNFDFEGLELDKNPSLWPGTWKFFAKDVDGSRVLQKPPSKRNLKRHNLILAPPHMSDYTVQADLMSRKEKRRRADMGLIAQRYYLDLMGRHQKLQVRSWPAELRMMKQVDFAWDPDVWYTMKLRVDVEGGKAVIKGKVWPRGQQEPQAWTITAEDPIPNLNGSPGLYGDAATDIYYDNIKITRSN